MTRFATPETAIATEAVLFGRGLEPYDETAQTYPLSPLTQERAEFAAGYVLKHLEAFETRKLPNRDGGLVVAPGSFTPTASYPHGKPKPPQYEGVQMTEIMHDRGVPPSLTLAVGVAATTLQETLYVRERYPFGRRWRPTPQNPLGLFGHDEQVDRIVWLAKRVLDVPANCLLPLVVGKENARPGSGFSERTTLSVTRLAFTAAHSPHALRRREQLVLKLRGLRRKPENSTDLPGEIIDEY